MRSDIERCFARTLETYGYEPSAAIVENLLKFFETVLFFNPRLHLTTIVEPEAFARRHIGEALEVRERIASEVRELWDVGSGLGVPGIPIAIVRPELPVVLVEGSSRKGIYLEEVISEIGLGNVRVVNKEFNPESVPAGACITARAVEKMGKVVESFLRSDAEQILVLGGEGLLAGLSLEGWECFQSVMRGSQSSFVYDLQKNVPRGTSRRFEFKL